MSNVTAGDITFTDVNIDNNDFKVSGNVVKEGLTNDLLKIYFEKLSGKELNNKLSSINAFSINWNGAKLTYNDGSSNKVIYTTADLLSLLDYTYNMSSTLATKYNELLEKYKELLEKYNGN